MLVIVVVHFFSSVYKTSSLTFVKDEVCFVYLTTKMSFFTLALTHTHSHTHIHSEVTRLGFQSSLVFQLAAVICQLHPVSLDHRDAAASSPS